MTDNNQPFHCYNRLHSDPECKAQCDVCKDILPEECEVNGKTYKASEEAKEQPVQSQETGEVTEIKRAIQMIYVASMGLSVNQSGYVAEEVYSQFIQPLQQENEKLRQWKESAISVTPDMQEIGKAIGVKLGHSVHDKILPAITFLKAQIETLKGIRDLYAKILLETNQNYQQAVSEIERLKPVTEPKQESTEAGIRDLLHELEYDPYPEDIFPPVSSDDLKKINELLQEHLNMPIDRLSAHIGRILRKPLQEKARAIYEKFKGEG